MQQNTIFINCTISIRALCRKLAISALLIGCTSVFSQDRPVLFFTLDKNENKTNIQKFESRVENLDTTTHYVFGVFFKNGESIRLVCEKEVLIDGVPQITAKNTISNLQEFNISKHRKILANFEDYAIYVSDRTCSSDVNVYRVISFHASERPQE